MWTKIGTPILLIGIGACVYQVAQRWADGLWTPYQLSEMLRDIGILKRVDGIGFGLDYVLALPVSLTILLIGLGMIFYQVITDWRLRVISDRTLKEAREKREG